MKINLFCIGLLLLVFSSCGDKAVNTPINSGNKILVLKVDYLTNKFEGGKELSFSKETPKLTIQVEYKDPGDFGNIKLIYKELNEAIFDGGIVWMGKGEISYPKNFLEASQFSKVLTCDIVYPNSGFKNIFNPNHLEDDFQSIWTEIQRLEKVRQYLAGNPDVEVQYFLYTPSVGVGDPADWDWIIFLKN